MTAVVVPVPCLKDNYAYLVHQESSKRCIVVDPSEAAPVLRACQAAGLELAAILNTHHHWDHVGGNPELAGEGLPVFGHESDAKRIFGLSEPLSHGQTFSVAGLSFRALHVPGHTLGAVSYLCEGKCFTGDTLFCGGCGRLFEGTPAQMLHSLSHTLGQLPDETEIFVGHEYTEQNLRFAAALAPSDSLNERLAEVEQRRAEGKFCASARLALERATNPFLRCHLPDLQEILGASENELIAFTKLRKLKDAA